MKDIRYAYREGKSFVKSHLNSIITGFMIWMLLCTLAPVHIHAQFYDRGNPPIGRKWIRIKTRNFNVIAPDYFIDQGKQYASRLEMYYDANSELLQHKPAKVPVVIHPTSVESNGFVAWAPKRMELISTPRVDSYAEPWMDQLVKHEFRHVVQVDKLKQGFTRYLSWFTGEQAVGIAAAAVPFWFLEGDAVDAETRLSHAGRGRLPSFSMELKAIRDSESGAYSYEKAYYGSYKDHVPNHYQLGYQMVRYGREQYGDRLWDEVLDYTGRYTFTMLPFYFGLKKQTGLSKRQLYRETMDHLKKQTASEQVQWKPGSLVINPPSREYTAYRMASVLPTGEVLAEKRSLDDIPRFVLIDSTGREKIIHTPGFYYPVNISLVGNRLVWAETVGDPLWSYRSYSVIKTLDMTSGKERMVTRQSRLFTPVLHSDGLRIAAVHVSPGNKYAIQIIALNSGDVIASFDVPQNEYPQYLTWLDEHRLGMTLLGNKGKSLYLLDLGSGRFEQITAFGYEDMAELQAWGEGILFRSTRSGTDNIHYYDLEERKEYRLTDASYGAFNPTWSAPDSSLVYSDYSSRGYDLVTVPARDLLWKDVPTDSKVLRQPHPYAEEPPDPEEIKVEPYNRLAQFFRLHSWSPFYFDYNDPDVEDPKVAPGVTLLSQNLLSTATTVLGYEYRDGDHLLHTRLLYEGIWPHISLGWDYGGLPLITQAPDGVDPPGKVNRRNSFSLKASFPLDLTANRFVTRMVPSAEWSYTNAYFFYRSDQTYRSGINYMDFRFYFYNFLKTSARDILPRWGQVYSLRLFNAPFENEQLGSISSGRATWYLPGILKHHSLKLGAAFQNQDTKRFLFGNHIRYPRGMTGYTSEQLRLLSADYVLPLFYPDWNIGSVAYIKRFRASLYADYVMGKNVYFPGADGTEVIDLDRSSFGFTLTADFHPFHSFFPVNSGIQLTYLPHSGEWVPGFILGIDLNSF